MEGPYSFMVVGLTATAMFIAVVSFVAVIFWTRQRRRERESYYHSENIKRVTEAKGADAALEYVREVDRIAARQGKRRAQAAGVTVTAFSLGLLPFLWATRSPYPYAANDYLIGIVPLFVGLALLLYGYVLAPRQ
jgi:hypothetical protein